MIASLLSFLANVFGWLRSRAAQRSAEYEAGATAQEAKGSAETLERVVEGQEAAAREDRSQSADEAFSRHDGAWK